MLMGILNLTPDSFSDGGSYPSVDAAVEHGLRMSDQGAEIIDLGGESTRPGSVPVPAGGQLRRVLAPLRQLRERLPGPALLSIDTTSAEVAEAALDTGADWVNDVSAGSDSPRMFSLVAERAATLVLMHRGGETEGTAAPADFPIQVRDYLLRRAELAQAAGVSANRLLLDPGIGFGKTRQQNLSLLACLDCLVDTGFPVLLGASRKRFMGSLSRESDPRHLVAATCATTALGVASGVRVFRVHDVAENRQAADVAWAVRQAAGS